MTKTELPKWFNGQVYEKGDTVTNPYSGQSYELTAEELSMYDFIIGATIMYETDVMTEKFHNKLVTNLRKGLDWFRKNNVEAYYVLLD
tara:strand:- start:60 stop:323 length:264 start_codon:yes stop_codon:yes gene_type:complete